MNVYIALLVFFVVFPSGDCSRRQRREFDSSFNFPSGSNFPNFPNLPSGSNFPSLPSGSNFPSLPSGSNFPSLPSGSNFPSLPSGSNFNLDEFIKNLPTSVDINSILSSVNDQNYEAIMKDLRKQSFVPEYVKNGNIDDLKNWLKNSNVDDLKGMIGHQDASTGSPILPDNVKSMLQTSQNLQQILPYIQSSNFAEVLKNIKYNQHVPENIKNGSIEDLKAWIESTTLSAGSGSGSVNSQNYDAVHNFTKVLKRMMDSPDVPEKIKSGSLEDFKTWIQSTALKEGMGGESPIHDFTEMLQNIMDNPNIPENIRNGSREELKNWSQSPAAIKGIANGMPKDSPKKQEASGASRLHISAKYVMLVSVLLLNMRS